MNNMSRFSFSEYVSEHAIKQTKYHDNYDDMHTCRYMSFNIKCMHAFFKYCAHMHARTCHRRSIQLRMQHRSPTTAYLQGGIGPKKEVLCN